jgi:DNA polymerase-3 subunit delta
MEATRDRLEHLAMLAEACARAGQVLLYDIPKPKDPAAWVRAEFARLGAQADDDAARALVELVGTDVSLLAGEIEKIATWAAGGEVTQADVAALAVPAHEEAAWALTDAWGARDVGAVLRAAERMLDRTGDPVSRTIPRLVGSLTNHVRRARTARRLEEQGMSPQEAAPLLGMRHHFPAQKLFAQVRNFSGAELDDALIRLAELDHALKGGSRLANELELERALVEITVR